MRTVALSICVMLLAVIFVFPQSTDAAIVVVFEDDAIDEIPIPGEEHTAEPIQHIVCAPQDCHMEGYLDNVPLEDEIDWWTNQHEVISWSGSFNSSEDRDALLLEPLRNDSNPPTLFIPSEHELAYDLCIDYSEVAMKVEAWWRNGQTLQQLAELTAATPLDHNSSIDSCTRFIFSAGGDMELWFEASTLSTAGNYSLLFRAIEIGQNDITPLMTHDLSIEGSEFTSAYKTSGNSLAGNHSVMLHPTDRDYVWNLKSIANHEHSIRLYCSLADASKFECGHYHSSPTSEGMHSMGSDMNYHIAPDGVIAFELILELDEPSIWAIEHDMINSYADPIMWYFEVEPYIDELSMTKFPGGDAPGNLSDLQCDMDSVHHLGCRYFPDNDGVGLRAGYMPLSTFDEADVYAIDISSAQGDMTFILEVQIQALPGSVMLELHTIDINGTVTVSSLTPMSDDVETLRLEVNSGVHYLRVVNIRMGVSQNWSYGDLDQSVIEYWLKVDWIHNSSGEYVDLSPSEELLFWDAVLLWTMGPIFLIPLAWVLLNIRKDRIRVETLLQDRQRLARLRSLNNPDEIKEARRDLTAFISALTMVDWDVLLTTWGEPDVSHVTEDVRMHMWRLADELAEPQNIPLLVMVEVVQDDWNISALRFEALEGSPWEVTRVQPSLLSRNHEIFLDDLRVGNRIFVNVELSGEGKRIALHLSGVQRGGPVAAKPAKSLLLESEEE